MSSVDSRVVQMKFDGSNFQNGISNALSSIAKLKAGLNFDQQTKSMEQLEEVANDMDFSGMSNGVETVTAKFSMLNAIAVDAVVNIARNIEQKLVKAVKALSVDNVMAGWNKYAEKTTAVQTIMSATESTWQNDANKTAYVDYLKETAEYSGFAEDALESMAEMYEKVSSGALTAKKAQKQYNLSAKEYEGIMTSLGNAAGFEGSQIEYVDEMIAKLNWFTDETSYKLTDMTSNIGKFTANGIALSDAVVAMEGISVWASKSGQGVNQAGMAMYNLSQAMSNGVVKKEDWKSIQNANMATMEFKQTAIDTAVELGYLRKTAEGAYETTAKTAKQGKKVTVESFDATLTETEWFTKDVLMGTLNEYGAFTQKLSDLMEDERFEMIDTTSEFLKMLDTYDEATDKEAALSKMAKETGIDIETLRETMVELTDEQYKLGRSAFKAAQEAKTFEEAMDATKEAVATGWMNTFEIIFGNYEQAKVLWTNLANDLWDIFAGGAEGRNDFLRELFDDLGGREVFLEIYSNSMEGLKQAIQYVKDIFHEVFPPATAKTALIMMQRIRDLTKNLLLFNEEGEFTGGLISRVFGGAFKTALVIVKSLIDSFRSVIGIFKIFKIAGKQLWANIAPDGEQIDLLEAFFGTIQKGAKFLAGLVEKFRIFLQNKILVTNIINTSSAVKILKDGMQLLHDKVIGAKDAFAGFFSELHKTKEESEGNRFERLSKVFDVLKGIFGGLWNVAKQLAPVIGKVFGVIGEGLKVLGNGLLEAVSTGNFNILTDLFSVGIMGGIFELIKKLTSVTGVFEDFFGGVTGSMEAMQNQLKAETIMQIAKAVLMLAGAALILSLIDSNKLLASVGSIAFLVGELGAIMESLAVTMGANGSTKKGPFAALDNLSRGMMLSQMSSALLKLAGSVMILAVAMKVVASIKEEDLARSVLAISALVWELTGALVVISKYGGKDKGAAALIGMGLAILMITSAIKKLGELDFVSLLKGVGAVVVLIAALTGALILMSKFGARGGFSMLLAATGIVILAGALKILATIKFTSLVKGIIAVGAMLLVLAIGLTAMIAALPGAAALLVASVGLIALAAAMKIFATIPLGGLLKGIIAIAGLLVVLAVGLTAMLFALPGAVALGVFAVSLTMLLGPLEILSRMKWKTILSAIGKLLVIIVALALGTLLLIPGAIALVLFGAALTLCAIAITAISTSFALLALSLTMVTAVGKAAIDTLLSMIKSFLKGIVDIVPILFNIIKSVLVGLRTILPDFFDFVIDVIEGICDAAVTLFPKIIDTVFALVETLIIKLGENAPKLAEAGLTALLAIVNGLADAIETHKEDIADAVWNLCGAILDAFLSFFGIETDEPLMGKKGWQLVSGFIDGLWEAIKKLGHKLWNAGKEIAEKICDGIATMFSIYLPQKLHDVLSDMVNDPDTPWPVRYFLSNIVQATEGWLNLMKMPENGDTNPWRALQYQIEFSHPLGSGNLDYYSEMAAAWDKLIADDQKLLDLYTNDYETYLDIISAGGTITEEKAKEYAIEARKRVTQKARGSTKGVVVNTGYVRPVSNLSDYSSLGGSISALLAGELADTSGISTHSGSIGNQLPIATSYTFNQYNTSPAELSTSDIYRNTKSQFAQMTRVVSAR